MSQSKKDTDIDSGELPSKEAEVTSPGDMQRKRESEIELALNLHFEGSADAGKGIGQNCPQDNFEVPKLSPEEFAQLLKQQSSPSGSNTKQATATRNETSADQSSRHSPAGAMDYVNLIKVRTNRYVDISLKNLRWKINSDETLKRLIKSEFIVSDEEVIQLILLHYFEPEANTSPLKDFLESRIVRVSSSTEQATERLYEILRNFTSL